MAEHALLDAALERSLSAFGTLEPQVLARAAPHVGSDQQAVLWPAELRGKLRMVRRPGGGVLIVTHGLSYPFDPELHGAVVPQPLGYELGIEIDGSEPFDKKTFATATNAELANAWPVHALWFLSGCYLEDRWDLLEHLEQFGLVSGVIPPLPGLERVATTKGTVGVLLGIPLGAPTGQGRGGQLLLAREGELESRLVLLTVLAPDELAYVTSVPDATHAVDVVTKLAALGPPHRSSAVRRSVLG